MLAFCLWKAGLRDTLKGNGNLKSKDTDNISCQAKPFTSIPLRNLLYNIGFCLIMLLLLMLCGDVPPNPGPMKFCHLNARSILSGVDLNTHMEDQYSLLDDIYECLVYINEFDVIAISETWLKDSVREDALDLAGYQKPLMKNRNARGGGVMLYVRDHIGSIHRTDLEDNDTEILWVELRLKNKKVLFATCYRPPGATALQVDNFIDNFSSQVENAMNENPDALILVGDFNRDFSPFCNL